MKIFNLPDLGEGLPDAEIREWYVKVGDTVKQDQPLAAMETAKALVDVPSPYAGTIEKLYGEPGDRINTDEPLIGFSGEADAQVIEPSATLETSTTTSTTESTNAQVKTSPAIRALAKKLGVDLNGVTGTGPNGMITSDDVKNADQADDDYQELPNVRRAMALAMTRSHQNVVPVSLCDDADISHWQQQDVTARIIRAVIAGCQASPSLNAHYDADKMALKLFDVINLGIAVDTDEGLFVPVIQQVNHKSAEELRSELNTLKTEAQAKSFSAEQQKGATLVLTNFGSIAGRYSNPIVTPPMTAIIGVGKMYQAAKVMENGELAAGKFLPISISIDHRPITGGEAARFMAAMIMDLQK